MQLLHVNQNIYKISVECKILRQNEDFLDKQKLKEFVANRPSLQEK